MSSLKDRRSSRTESPVTALPVGPAEVVIGTIAGVGGDGVPLVDYPGNPAGQPVPALATARYDGVPSGAPVALMFVDGDPARPLAIGKLAAASLASAPEPGSAPTDEQPAERLVLSATREIVLQCGRASLVLTRAGKVLVRGAYVSLRSSGLQRITGASVQIN
jgi:hypothetical protein